MDQFTQYLENRKQLQSSNETVLRKLFKEKLTLSIINEKDLFNFVLWETLFQQGIIHRM